MTTPTTPRRPNQCLSFSRALFGFAGVLLTLTAMLYFVFVVIGVTASARTGDLARHFDMVTLGTIIGSEAGMLILAALCWRGAGWRDPA